MDGVVKRPSARIRRLPFHVVFTFPAQVADIAFRNKALVYDLRFKAASETMLTIAADPRHLAPASVSPPCFTHGVQGASPAQTDPS